MSCVSCGGRHYESSTHCKACIRAARSEAPPKWLKEPEIPAILRATPMRRGKDTETLPMFDDGAGSRPAAVVGNDGKKRVNRKRRA